MTRKEPSLDVAWGSTISGSCRRAGFSQIPVSPGSLWSQLLWSQGTPPPWFCSLLSAPCAGGLPWGGPWGLRLLALPTHRGPRSRFTSSFNVSFSPCSRCNSLAAKGTD